jgi:hypothetical protein
VKQQEKTIQDSTKEISKDYSFDIDESRKIIFYKHSGTLTHVEIGTAWRDLLQVKEFTELKYNLFSDYREAIYDMPADMTKEIVAFLSTLKPILNDKKQAILIEDTYSTAISVLFQSRVVKEVGFIVKTFATEQAALKWLNY